VAVTVGVRRIHRAAPEDWGRRVRHVERDEPTVPAGAAASPSIPVNSRALPPPPDSVPQSSPTTAPLSRALRSSSKRLRLWTAPALEIRMAPSAAPRPQPRGGIGVPACLARVRECAGPVTRRELESGRGPGRNASASFRVHPHRVHQLGS
jgi:hypothetical protein